MPADAGMSRAPAWTRAICSSLSAASLAPKSTDPDWKRRCPSPLPTAS